MKNSRNRVLNSEEQKNAKIAYLIAFFGILGFLSQLLYFRINFGGFSDWWVILIYWIVFIMPGYLANAMMVTVGNLGHGNPLDGGELLKMEEESLVLGKQ